VFVPATVHAALEQGSIPMTVAIRVYMFKKSCTAYQLCGASILTVGLVVMAVVSRIDTDLTHSRAPIYVSAGIALLVIAAVLLAGRYVAEEILMQEQKIPPLVVTGAQGAIGSMLSVILILLAHYMGYEDFWHTVGMLRASRQVRTLVVEFVALTMVYNWSMAYTTQMFDATYKAMVRGTKPMSVWLLQLFWFYILSSRSDTQVYGEMSWTMFFSASAVTCGLCLYFYKNDKSTPKQDEGEAERGTLITK
jgi:hypothetical protein